MDFANPGDNNLIRGTQVNTFYGGTRWDQLNKLITDYLKEFPSASFNLDQMTLEPWKVLRIVKNIECDILQLRTICPNVRNI